MHLSSSYILAQYQVVAPDQVDPPLQIAPALKINRRTLPFSLNPLKASWSPLGSPLAACEHGQEPERTMSLSLSASAITFSITSLSILPLLHFNLDLICPLNPEAFSSPLFTSPTLSGSLWAGYVIIGLKSNLIHAHTPTHKLTNPLPCERKWKHDRDTDAPFLSSSEWKFFFNLMIIRWFFLNCCEFTVVSCLTTEPTLFLQGLTFNSLSVIHHCLIKH